MKNKIILLSVMENNCKVNILVVPNPLCVSTSGKATHISTIEISNVLRENVYEYVVPMHTIKEQMQHPIVIDFSMQPKGIYFVKVQEGRKTYTEKIVVS